ncbi:MAG: HAMP domain-containing sensor histidine kinase [Candidatus Moranbacteria bacterium]|nr:HAMP domain-containing sensor histidine kinase [Candidatus Moranbacteria bacterium]
MKKIKFNLQWKLTLSFLLVIVAAVTIIGLSANYYIYQHFQEFCESSGVAIPRCMEGKAGHAFLTGINKALAWTVALGALISLLFGYVLSKLILSPLQKVMKAAKKFSEGNYETRINTTTNDEINDLIKTLNEMFFSLEKLEKLRKDLVANLSHELATPLTNIYGYLEAIDDNVIKDETERSRAILLVKKEAERLIRLTKELKNLTVLESDNFSLAPEQIDLNELIKTIKEKFALKMEQKNITLREAFDPELPTVKMDPVKMEQVVFNLLDNAIKYSAKDGIIKLKTWRESEQIAFSIKDSGPGIPREDLPFIFERFYRADKSRTKKDNSAGIGLTITKKIVEAHKGSIEIKSEKDWGSKFVVYLPVL